MRTTPSSWITSYLSLGLLAALIVLATATALSAAPAYANDDIAAAETGELSTQADSKTLWVVDTSSFPANGGGMTTTKYGYNSNGLLVRTSTSNPNFSDYSDASTFKYSGTLLKSSAYKRSANGSTTSYKRMFKYNGKGQLVTLKVASSDNSGSSSDPTKFKYDSKGNLKKAVSQMSWGSSTVKFTSYDSEGRLIKKVSDPGNGTNSTTYKYDGNGNVVKVTRKYSSSSSVYATEYDLTYDTNGCLVKSADAAYPEGNYKTYTYKKVAVPKDAVETVLQQQRIILNPSLPNYTLPLSD